MEHVRPNLFLRATKHLRTSVDDISLCSEKRDRVGVKPGKKVKPSVNQVLQGHPAHEEHTEFPAGSRRAELVEGRVYSRPGGGSSDVVRDKSIRSEPLGERNIGSRLKDG